MLKSITATALIVLVATACLAAEEPTAAPTKTVPSTGGAAPDGRGADIARHREMLGAQCPEPAAPSKAAAMPIHVTTWGTSGPKVLIVHGGVQGGLGGGPRTFSKQEPLSGRGWTLEVVDRPGFGDSPSRGVDDMEADSLWIAEKLDSGANLIGHSWGGAEALLAAARRPDAVRSLVLVEPALQSLLVGNPIMAREPAATADAGRFAQLLLGAATPGAYGLAFARNLGASNGGGATDAAAALAEDHARATKLGCALLQGRMASPAALRRAAGTVAEAGIPVLVVTGGWSPFFDAVGEVAASMTHGRHVVVRSPNHFVQLSSPEEFNSVVDGFMREADRNRTSSTPANAEGHKTP